MIAQGSTRIVFKFKALPSILCPSFSPKSRPRRSSPTKPRAGTTELIPVLASVRHQGLIKSLATPSCSFTAAHPNSVRSFLSGWLGPGSTSFRPSIIRYYSSMTTSSCLLWAPHRSGVLPPLSGLLRSISLCPKRSLATPICSLFTARTSGARPAQSPWLISRPLTCINAVTSLIITKKDAERTPDKHREVYAPPIDLKCTTGKTRIIEPHARTRDLPLLAGSEMFYFVFIFVSGALHRFPSWFRECALFYLLPMCHSLSPGYQ